MAKARSARRDLIRAAAADLVVERGRAEAVTLDEVAARAGTTKATIYRYFSNKAALLAELTPAATEPTVGRRDQLLDTAMQMVRQHGVAGATMERIADAAGVSPAALYWHFKNREQLLAAMIARVAARLEVPGASASGEVPEPSLLFGAVAPRVMVLQADNIELLAAVLAGVIDHPALADAVYEQLVAPVWGQLSDYLRGAAKRGQVRPGDPMLQVAALIGMITFYNLVRRAFGARTDLPPPEEAAPELVRIFLEGVQVAPRRPV